MCVSLHVRARSRGQVYKSVREAPFADLQRRQRTLLGGKRNRNVEEQLFNWLGVGTNVALYERACNNLSIYVKAYMKVQ